MTRITLRAMLPLAATFLLSMTLASVPRLAAQAPDAAAHQQWMNDASDAQEDFRFAITDKNQKAAVEALGRRALAVQADAREQDRQHEDDREAVGQVQLEQIPRFPAAVETQLA